LERAQVHFELALKGDATHRAQGVQDLTEAEKRGPATRRLHCLGAQLYALAIDESPTAIAQAERHFQAMRRMDKPEANYDHLRLAPLFRKRPELRDLWPDPSRQAAPD